MLKIIGKRIFDCLPYLAVAYVAGVYVGKGLGRAEVQPEPVMAVENESHQMMQITAGGIMTFFDTDGREVAVVDLKTGKVTGDYADQSALLFYNSLGSLPQLRPIICGKSREVPLPKTEGGI
jgi:hypothetical protein